MGTEGETTHQQQQQQCDHSNDARYKIQVHTDRARTTIKTRNSSRTATQAAAQAVAATKNDARNGERAEFERAAIAPLIY